MTDPEHLDELLAQADEVIAHPESHIFEPILILKLLVALVREIRPPVGDPL